MSLGRQLFRESALQRLQSPEQLDQVLQVTSPKGWLALTAIWALLILVVVWSFIGRAPTKEMGRGIILPIGSLERIDAESTGPLEQIRVERGQSVEPGDVVAVIKRAELEDKLADTQAELQDLVGQHDLLQDNDEQEMLIRTENAEAENQQLDVWIKFLKDRIDYLDVEERANWERALKADAAKQHEYSAFLERLELKKRDLQQAEYRKLEIHKELTEARLAAQSRRTARELERNDVARRIDTLQKQLDRESLLISASRGRVAEIRAAVGNMVETGDIVMLIEPVAVEAELAADAAVASGDVVCGVERCGHLMSVHDPTAGCTDAGCRCSAFEMPCPCESREYAALEAVVYVSARTGKNVYPGHTAHVSPSTVKREEFGSIVGMVTSVAANPTSIDRMMTILNDRNLVEELRADVGVPLEITVALCRQEDELNLSGLQWTSKLGPPVEVSVGTLADVAVTVQSRSPIELVIPRIKGALGGD
ncbi:MAG: hypothetical protein ACYTJ0_02690 [Planctomycetota bacterium]|jgi:HlyD family secretion protein